MNFVWTEMNEFVLQNLPTEKGSFWMRGETASGQVVHGLYIGVNRGLGFAVAYMNDVFILINNFAYSLSCPPRLSKATMEDIEDSTEDIVPIHTATIRFWLSSGVSTKSALTMKERKSWKLLDPMSEEGLAEPTMGLPILSHLLYSQVHFVEDDMDECKYTEYFLRTGKIMPHIPGNMAPKPLSWYIVAAEKERLGAWHLARATKNRMDHRMTTCIVSKCKKFISYYEFDDPTHTLRIEEFYPGGFKAWSMKLPTHPARCPVSPNISFTLSSIVPDGLDISGVMDITGVDDTFKEEVSYTTKISRMSQEDLLLERLIVKEEFIAMGQKLADIMLEEKIRSGVC